MLKVLVILFALIPSWGLAQEKETPSLAELARTERQRRDSSGEVISVITNATLKSGTQGRALPSVGASLVQLWQSKPALVLDDSASRSYAQPDSVGSEVFSALSLSMPGHDYLLGIGYTPFENRFTYVSALKKLKEAANILYIQRHWQEAPNPNQTNFDQAIAEDVAFARKNGLQVYLAFEILSPFRNALELPNGMQGDFTDRRVRTAYVDLVREVSERYQPDYFILNVEVNLYRDGNLGSYNAYREAYSRAYDAVKSVSPSTKVGVSLALNDFNQRDCIDDQDLGQLQTSLADFPKQDIFAVSVYPNCLFQPSRMPDNFLLKIADLSGSPLFISETGWMSEGVALSPSFFFSSSEGAQSEYVQRLERSAAYAVNHGKRIDAINYVQIADVSQTICDAIVEIDPRFSWYCSLALVRKDGTIKPAYSTLKKWSERLASTQ